MTTKEFERMQRLNMLKSLCFEDHALYSWTFDKDNGKNPIMGGVARDYVSKWSGIVKICAVEKSPKYDKH